MGIRAILVILVSLVFFISRNSAKALARPNGNASTTGVSKPNKRNRFVLNLVPSASAIAIQTQAELGDDPLIPIYAMAGREPLMMVKFRIGEPEITQYAIMDTGSNRKWIMCRNKFNPRLQANEDPDTTVIFDPSKSTSFKMLPCSDPTCPPLFPCPTPNSPCGFEKNYRQAITGKTLITGNLATESFTFDTYDDGITHQQVVFGCTRPRPKATFSPDKRFNGVFGLADPTFLANVGNGNPRFSYCIGDLTNPNETSNHLQLGEDVELDGAIATTLELGEGSHLTVVVESISVGDEDVHVDPHRMAIDAGTRIMWFAPQWHFRIEQKIAEAMKELGFSTYNEHRYAYQCFSGTMKNNKALDALPGFKLQFQDGVAMVLGLNQLFFQLYRNVFCLAARASDVGPAVLGLWAQQGFNVGFDLAAKRLYFYQVDCSSII